MTDAREERLVRAFVSLADSLVEDFDMIDLLQTLVDRMTDLLDVAASGVLLGPDADHLQAVVSTGERSRLLGLLQVRAGEGPGIEAVATGEVVSVADPAGVRDRWPVFAAEAAGDGHVPVHAIPLRLRGLVLGSLTLFRDHGGALDTADAVTAQALADVATIGILQERSIRDGLVVHDQLRRALDSRVVIEQAKGIVAQLHGVDMDAAFRLMRHRARDRRATLATVAADVIEGREAGVLGRSSRSRPA